MALVVADVVRGAVWYCVRAALVAIGSMTRAFGGCLGAKRR